MPNQAIPQHIAWGLTLALLGGLTVAMLWPLGDTLAWALVLAAVTWPAYRAVRRVIKGETAAALAMLLLVALAVGVPLALILGALLSEVRPALDALHAIALAPPVLPEWLARYPQATQAYQELLGHLNAPQAWLQTHSRGLIQPGTRALASLGGTLIQGLLTLFVLFFVYRNGEGYRRQTLAVLSYVLGERVERLVDPTKQTMRAVFAGVLLAALSQGVVAGLGYAVLGLPAPVLLSLATAVLAIIPFGATLVWGGAALSLLAGGATVKGLVMLGWGFLLVSNVDNVVRPLVISGGAKLPYLQTFLFTLGGLALLGFLGLFIGPAVLAIWMVLWQEWVHASEPDVPASVA